MNIQLILGESVVKYVFLEHNHIDRNSIFTVLGKFPSVLNELINSCLLDRKCQLIAFKAIITCNLII